MSPSVLTAVLFAVFGAVLGSAVTAIVWRLPRGLSWVHGRSRCSGCQRELGPLDLVPLLSWLLARGRCRTCGARVSARYPLIEAWCAAWAVLAWWHTGPSPALVPELLWGCLLVALTFIDLDFQVLPHALTVPGIALGLTASLLGDGGWRHAALGIAVGAGYQWFFLWVWQRFMKREGLGFGDVMLGAMFGALLGPVGAFVTVFVAALAGSLVGAVMMARGQAGMRTALPFGTFLAPAAMLVHLWGRPAIDAYLSLFRR
jgi:leader peptidase (prepilin peptidase)/N-methyltransferase